MKFIVDAQLPKRLANFFSQQGHDALHTINLARKNATGDRRIIDIAKESNSIIVSKDKDFYYSAILDKEPIKLIMVSTGNIHNNDLISLFRENLEKICELIEQHQVIEIDTTSVTIHV